MALVLKGIQLELPFIGSEKCVFRCRYCKKIIEYFNIHENTRFKHDHLYIFLTHTYKHIF